jgi:hypothetical protein
VVRNNCDHPSVSASERDSFFVFAATPPLEEGMAAVLRFHPLGDYPWRFLTRLVSTVSEYNGIAVEYPPPVGMIVIISTAADAVLSLALALRRSAPSADTSSDEIETMAANRVRIPSGAGCESQREGFLSQ